MTKRPKTMRLYRGRSGPGVGYLKSSKPTKRDADNDNVVQERKPKRRYPLAPPKR